MCIRDSVYSILGDGEIAEGQVWEAAMAANKFHLDNLCAVIDLNGLQIDGTTEEVMPTEPVDKKFESFGWHVIKIDGHDFEQIDQAFEEAKATKGPVSYTHLDVYKRQVCGAADGGIFRGSARSQTKRHALAEHCGYLLRHRQQRRPSGPEESKRQERTGCIACAASGKGQSKGYADGIGYDARFTQCGICTLMKKLGLYDLTPAMCHLDYTCLLDTSRCV